MGELGTGQNDSEVGSLKELGWLKNCVIYQILVDRFSTGDDKTDLSLASKTSMEHMGGNLKGVIKRLGHIKSTGAGVIYLSPIYKSTSYHGYDVVDFFKIDERFGNEEDLRVLVQKSHEMGMKVIMDFVPNHCSSEHPFFLDATEKEKSEYQDWFVFEKWPDEYLCFLDFRNLPKINLDNDKAREYMITAAEHWINGFDIDGYRLDHAIGPSLSFWREFRRRTKKTKEDFVLIGEVWFRGIDNKHLKTLWLVRDFSHDTIDRISRESMTEGESIEMNRVAFKEIEKMNIFDGCLDFYFMENARKVAKGELGFETFQKMVLPNIKKNSKRFQDGHLLKQPRYRKVQPSMQGHFDCKEDDKPSIFFEATENDLLWRRNRTRTTEGNQMGRALWRPRSQKIHGLEPRKTERGTSKLLQRNI